MKKVKCVFPLPQMESYLNDKGMRIMKVRGDGHCLLYAFQMAVNIEGLCVSIDDLTHKLEKKRLSKTRNFMSVLLNPEMTCNKTSADTFILSNTTAVLAI